MAGIECLTTKEATDKWGITPRRVQMYCKEGRIEGAISKGSSFADLDQDKVRLMMNHINSKKRDSLNEHSPYELSLLLLGNKIHKALGLELVAPDEVMLCPALL